jgi:protocatechuate 3,4-dioxygenase beta subunit
MTPMASRPILATLLLVLALGALPAPSPAQEGAPSSMATLWREGDAGERLELRGQVVDAAGQPLAGATIYVRQADGAGIYADSYSGRMVTDRDGAYVLRTALPGNYGGVRHIHMTVTHPGHASVDTRVLFKDDANLPAGLLDEAIVLDETSIGGERLWIGTFDVVLGRP